MNILLAHAEGDREAARAAASSLDRPGFTVMLDTTSGEGRPNRPDDVYLLLWSKAQRSRGSRFDLEQRALAAWADEQLILVRLDEAELPIGLRDLPVIDASSKADWPTAWLAVDALVQQHSEPGTGTFARPTLAAPTSERTPPSARWSQIATAALAGTGLSAVGFYQFTESTFSERAEMILGIAAVVVAAYWIVWLILRALEVLQAVPAKAVDPALPIFVSYAHADIAAVESVVAVVRANGLMVWIDTKDLKAGRGWAGEIVRRIRAARGVLVMCSARAFASDHVKREVYLAGRYKKRMLPVMIEAVDPPDDFEYFFADVQWLRLHETPADQRVGVISRAVAEFQGVNHRPDTA